MSNDLPRAVAAEATGTAPLVATGLGRALQPRGEPRVRRTGKAPHRASGTLLAAQLGGALLGVLVAHAMFEVPLLQVSVHARTGTAQWLAEAVATFGLIGTILGV